MNENRKQRRMAQKLPTRTVKRYSKILTLLLALIVLCGVFAVSGSAASIQDGVTNETPVSYAGAIAPFDTITFLTGTLTDACYYQYEFPRYRLFTEWVNYRDWSESIDDIRTITKFNQMDRYYTGDVPSRKGEFDTGFISGDWSFAVTENGTDYIPAYGFQMYVGDDYIELLIIDENYNTSYMWYSTDANANDDKIIISYTASDGTIYNDFYTAISTSYNNGEIDEHQAQCLYNIEEMTYPLRTEEQAPPIALNWDMHSNNSENELIYSSNTTEIDSRLHWKDNELYMIMFGEGKTISYNNRYNSGNIRINADTNTPIEVFWTIKAVAIETSIDANGSITRTFVDKYLRITNEYNAGVAFNLFPDLTSNDEFSAYFNANMPYLYIQECACYIHIYDLNSNDISIDWTLVHDETPPQINNWLLGQLGTLSPVVQASPTYLPDGSGFMSWLMEAVSSFMGQPILGTISLGEITWFCVGLGALFAVLKYFAGG